MCIRDRKKPQPDASRCVHKDIINESIIGAKIWESEDADVKKKGKDEMDVHEVWGTSAFIVELKDQEKPTVYQFNQ